MKSERLFKEVLSRILANGSVQPDDNKVVEMSLKLSRVYAEWGDHEKASAGFRFCVDTQEGKVAAAGADADEGCPHFPTHLSEFALISRNWSSCRTPWRCGA